MCMLQIFTSWMLLISKSKIYAHNHPLPKTVASQANTLQTGPTGLNIALLTIFGLGFLHASFAVFIVAVCEVTILRHSHCRYRSESASQSTFSLWAALSRGCFGRPHLSGTWLSLQLQRYWSSYYLSSLMYQVRKYAIEGQVLICIQQHIKGTDLGLYFCYFYCTEWRRCRWFTACRLHSARLHRHMHGNAVTVVILQLAPNIYWQAVHFVHFWWHCDADHGFRDCDTINTRSCSIKSSKNCIFRSSWLCSWTGECYLCTDYCWANASYLGAVRHLFELQLSHNMRCVSDCNAKLCGQRQRPGVIHGHRIIWYVWLICRCLS